MIRNESEILNVGLSKPPKVASRPAGWRCKPPSGVRAEPRSQKCVSKMKKKYDLTFKDMLITRCRVPRTFLGIQTVDGRFSDSSGILIKYFDHV